MVRLSACEDRAHEKLRLGFLLASHGAVKTIRIECQSEQDRENQTWAYHIAAIRARGCAML